jgi:hypothetical protein
MPWIVAQPMPMRPCRGAPDRNRTQTGTSFASTLLKSSARIVILRERERVPATWAEPVATSASSVMASSVAMTDIGDTFFHKGQPVWVIEPDGGQREAEYVGEGETSVWFGGPPKVFVVYVDTRTGAAVEVDRVIPRDV